MTQIANITVFDGAATPVSHTLVAISVTREKGKVIADWREQIASLPVSAQVRCQMSLEKLKTGVYKADTRVVVPVMETIGAQNAAGYTAAPKTAYEDTILITGFFHERSTSTGKRLVRQMAINIAGGITTSVTPVTSGPFADLFDLLVAPS